MVKRKMKNDLTRGAGQVAIWSWLDNVWKKARFFGGQEKLILGYNKTHFLIKLGCFLGQEKLIFGKNKTNYGAKQGGFLGQEKLISGHNKTKFRTNLGDFLGQDKLIFIKSSTMSLTTLILCQIVLKYMI